MRMRTSQLLNAMNVLPGEPVARVALPAEATAEGGSMTKQPGGAAVPAGPPWSVDVLSDLHAGVLEDAQAERLWPQVMADPEAMAVIDALDSTRTDLAALRDIPAVPMPADVAARIDAALAQEAPLSAPQTPFQASGTPVSPGTAQPPAESVSGPADSGVAPVVDLAAARRRRNKQLGLGAGLLTAAAAAVAIAVIPGNTIGGDPRGVLPPSGPTALTSEDVGKGLGSTLGKLEYGPLKNEARLVECLRANRIDPKIRPVGVREVTIDGTPAVLAVFTTGKLAQYRMVAFPTDCGPDKPGTLVDKTVGGTTK